MNRTVKYRRIISLVMAAMLIMTQFCPAFAASVKAKVTSSSANFYTKASTDSAHVDISKGATVTVTGVKNGWAKVKYKGVTGYMKTSALSRASAKKSKSWKSKVVALKWFRSEEHTSELQSRI